jgi:hypothetical protein
VNKQANVNRASFNGPNGVNAQESAAQKAAAANAKKMGPTSQQLERQQAASKDQNLRASVNKGNPNADAIKSFNKGEGAGQGKGAQGLGAAGGAGAGQGENKPGNMAEHNRQGEGAGQGQGGKGLGTAAEAGKGGNKPGNVTERNLEGAEAGNTGANRNKLKTGNQGNMRAAGGNQAKMHKGAGGDPARGPHAMNQQMSRHPQMGAQHPQGGGKHPQMGGGGNRPHPSGGQQQQQRKKKPGER